MISHPRSSYPHVGPGCRGRLSLLFLSLLSYLPFLSSPPYGGARGSRTLDLLNAIQSLSQLSYGPTRSAYEYTSRPPGRQDTVVAVRGGRGAGGARPRPPPHASVLVDVLVAAVIGNPEVVERHLALCATGMDLSVCPV